LDRQPCCRWKNGYGGSFNAKLRDELLNGESFTTLKEARIVIEGWRRHYNTVRPHSLLAYQPPAPEVVLWPGQASLGAKADHALGDGHAAATSRHCPATASCLVCRQRVNCRNSRRVCRTMGA
jgi:hypothetical protein